MSGSSKYTLGGGRGGIQKLTSGEADVCLALKSTDWKCVKMFMTLSQRN